VAKDGRTKGANFERKVAKILSEWSGMQLRRTPLSGGWARANPEVSGDVVCVEPGKIFPLHIECKNSEAWSWEQVWHGKGPVLNAWWDQTVDTCPKGKIPILVFSKAYHDVYVVLFPGSIPGSLRLLPFRNNNYAFMGGRYIIRLELFLEIFNVEDFRKPNLAERSDIRQREGPDTGREVQ
jgi:hypothetical protein